RPSEPSTVVLPSSPAPSKAPTPDVARCSALHLISHSCMSKQRPARRRTINIRPQPLCAGSGFMSTVDTHINWGSSYLVNDVYRRFLRPQAGQRELVV